MANTYQLAVRGGTIVDGTGRPPFRADIGIRDGIIVALGTVEGAADEEIDATGLSVTPGFVDVHTHYDGQITWENRMVPSSNHGITTVVMGNCGVGFAPCRDGDEDLMIRLMEGVEDIPEVVMAKGVPFNWTTFPEYLDAIASRESDVDFAAQIPHSPLRVFVMGQRGTDLEPPTDADLVQMRKLVTEAIHAGALGVSTSRNLFHRFRSGKLAPSVKSERQEFLALAAALKDAGKGVFQMIPDIDGEAESEIDLFNAILTESGSPLSFSLINTPMAPGNWQKYIDFIRSARERGMKVHGQFLPRSMGVLFGLDLSFHPFCLHPSYGPIADLPLEEKVAIMRDPAFRERLLSEQPDDPNPSFVALVTIPLHLYRVQQPADYDFASEDSLQAEAARTGRDLRDVIYDALLEDDGRAIICAYGTEAEETIAKTAELIGEDGMVVALGDAGAHYAMICDGAYPSYLLANRLGKQGLDLATIIKSLTSQPAASVGLFDRGRIAAGYKADLNLIDPDRIVLHRPVIERSLPAGGKRLAQISEGYVATIVSGVVTYRSGAATGALPGRLIRGSQQSVKVADLESADA